MTTVLPEPLRVLPPVRRPEPMLVGLRDAVSSRSAVQWAASRAVAQGVPLTLLHALPAPELVPPGTSYGDVVARGRTLVNQEAGLLARSHPGLRISASLHCGDVVDALLGLSESVPMIVLGTDRRNPAGGEFTGAVAVEVALNATAPVAVVPASYAYTSMTDHSRGGVVAAVDGSEVSRAALVLAAGEASRTRSSLTVVTVLGVTSGPMAVSASVMLVDVRNLYPGLPVSWIVDDEHRPDQALHLYGTGADLLVIGRHGAGARSARSLGSVTRTLLLEPPCPTVVVSL
ncbi:universal stress protein [Arthrobacter agilis]|uniref:universal stress protein n=1 Tax=Arthrobacter agilis TaxID=37921 RepID=UPI0027835484|nr:universal stress protein [Arthrobacter agilis]MDQ0734877.1 nucleotide-binding universal stress UspA family protein [Arthrobacter agilis]